MEVWWYDYRLPGGKVFDRLDEYKEFLSSLQDIQLIAQAAALKEAKEEVWIYQTDIDFFAVTHLAATIGRDLYYFVLTNSCIGEQWLESGEHITYERYPVEQVVQMCFNGSMQEERSCTILLRFLYQRELLSFIS
jgi:hypothetical protein